MIIPLNTLKKKYSNKFLFNENCRSKNAHFLLSLSTIINLCFFSSSSSSCYVPYILDYIVVFFLFFAFAYMNK